MYIDSIITQYPEGLDSEKYVIATYYCAVKPSTNLFKYGAALGVEQSCGTWLKVPGETEEIRNRCIGRLIGVYETPAYQIGLPEDIKERHAIFRIAFPWHNFGPQFSNMLTTVLGNISSSGKVKLLDLEFPKSFLKEFQGPKFGVQGLRDILKAYDRPLLNNMIKPCIGLNPKDTAALAFEAAVGGVDVIKDDELVSNPDFCPRIERIKAVQEVLKKADDIKGEKTLFAYNITDRTERLCENAYRAIEAGAEALMVNYNTVGLDSTRMLAEDPNINVPLLGHSDYTGAIYESPWSGMSASLICAKLPRLAGVDMIITLTPYGKFPVMMDTFVEGGYKMLMPLQNIKPVFALPGGGTTQGHVEDMVHKFGQDVMIASGGAIHGHPMGPRAGAKAFRVAMDAAMKGIPTDEAAKESKELQVALEAWGYYQEGKKGIFDLQG